MKKEKLMALDDNFCSSVALSDLSGPEKQQTELCTASIHLKYSALTARAHSIEGKGVSDSW